jgi:ATP-dependent Clp protease ATP-binding subunit ClpC
MHAFYEKVTDKARGALELANNYAKNRKHPLVTNLHILWGILDQGNNVGKKILENLKVDAKKLKLQVEAELGVGEYTTHGSAVAYDVDAQECICTAIDYGRRVNHIGCQHLLMALVDDKDNPVGRLLDKNNVTPELVLAEIKAIVRPVFVQP